MPKIQRRTTLALTGTAVAAFAIGAGALGASAQTGPGSDPTPAITAAVTTSPATAGVPAGAFTVTDVHVSQGTWASAQLEPAPDADLDPATAVLRFTDGAWQVVDLGTAQVGCGIVPADVGTELALSC